MTCAGHKMHTCTSSHIPQSDLWGCHTAKSKPKLCATRNSKSRTSDGAVRGIWDAYDSREIGLLVVLVARNNAVSLRCTSVHKPPNRHKVTSTDITFFGCQSMTVFFK